MSAFWAQIIAAVAGAVVTGGVRIFTVWLQRRVPTTPPPAPAPRLEEDAE